MQHFYKFITWRFVSLHANHQELITGQTTTNNAATITLQL